MHWPSCCTSASVARLPVRLMLVGGRLSGHLLLRNSQDPLISCFVPNLQTSASKVEDTVLSCESDIKFNKICGSQYNDRLGLGYTVTSKVPRNKSSKDYRRYISNHHRTIDDNYAMSKAV